MNRREFLEAIGSSPGGDGAVEVDCERLYIKYVDAVIEGRLPGFLRVLERDLQAVSNIVVVKGEWLARREFREAIESVLVRHETRSTPNSQVPTPTDKCEPLGSTDAVRGVDGSNGVTR